ncbi:MAG: SLC13 family permease [Actinomycetota bacterium]
MILEAWLTLAVVVAVVALLATERASPAPVVLGAVTALLVLGVVDTEQALSGFSNPAPLTVAALYVLAGAAEATGVLQHLTSRFLASIPKDKKGDKRALLRMLMPSAAASAFFNNTPIVAMVAPAVAAWARRTGRSPSAYLMPLSFGTILGGLLTLIGTSTTLVVSGLMDEAGMRPLGLFEIGKVGLPVAAAGIAFLYLFAPRILGDRRSPQDDLTHSVREFTVEMLVTPGGNLAGRTVSDAGLRNLQGVFLVEIARNGQRVAPVAPEEVLHDGDQLTFAGNVTRVLDLQRVSGLISAEERHFSIAGSHPQRRVYECVIGEDSPLSGTTLKEIGFRARYGGAVLAVHRSGQRVGDKLGDVRFRPGDVLVVLADHGFRRRWLDRHDYLVISPMNGETPPRRDKAPIVGIVALGLMALAGTGVLDIFVAAVLAAFALVILKVLSPSEARSAIDLNVIAVIAGSFGLGAAITESGLADAIARNVIHPLGSFGDLGLLLGILLATVALTELVTNNAAAVLMFPIAFATASAAGLDPRPFALAIALGASASFLTPIGYQTNTMVYGMGGYRFGDFVRLGGVITITTIVIGMLVIPIAWPLR